MDVQFDNDNDVTLGEYEVHGDELVYVPPHKYNVVRSQEVAVINPEIEVNLEIPDVALDHAPDHELSNYLNIKMVYIINIFIS